VGEIGIPRREYLYELEYWEVVLIVRGYFRKSREMWSATRWQTYNLMCVSMADLKKVGIYRPTDLIRFPWEKELPDGESNGPTKEEIEEMRRIMQEENARFEAGLSPNGDFTKGGKGTG
jgi:hypothetical protein